jgi:hypothetical protein
LTSMKVSRRTIFVIEIGKGNIRHPEDFAPFYCTAKT